MRTLLVTAASLIVLGAGCATGIPAPSAFSDAPSAPAAASAGRIDLSGKGLEAFPTEVLGRTDAVELDISDNRLTGAMPAEIRRLSRLKALDASGNRMTGVPAEIGQLSELETLDLSDNLLTGLPHELGTLPKLRFLDLRGNDISLADLEIIRAGLPGTEILTD